MMRGGGPLLAVLFNIIALSALFIGNVGWKYSSNDATNKFMSDAPSTYTGDDDDGVTLSRRNSAIKIASPEVILVADCVWLAQLIAPLLNTLKTYTTESTKVIITYQRRGKEAHEEFWEGIHDVFDVVAVDTEKTVELAKPDVFYVLECRKKER